MRPRVERITPEDWRLFRELRLAALEEAPDAFSTALAEWQGDGDTQERWRERLENVPFNAIAYLDGAPIGMVSGTKPNESGELELISMWVAPSGRRRGAGAALVDAVLRWARSQRLVRVALDVREENGSAIAFYERCGFIDAGPIEQPGPPERRMVRNL